MAASPGETLVLRSTTMRVIGAIAILAAVVMAALSVQDPATLTRAAAPVLLLALVGWAAFLNPRVEISDGGVVLVNVFRTVEVPWPAVESVEGRYGLQLRTAYGAFSAWSATAPGGRNRRHLRDSAAAQEVRRRWDALREAGWLDDPRLERPRARQDWHLPTIGAACALVVAGVALQLLG
jgi:hypothetical protein